MTGAANSDARKRREEARGGYASSERTVDQLAPPPSGPAPGGPLDRLLAYHRGTPDDLPASRAALYPESADVDLDEGIAAEWRDYVTDDDGLPLSLNGWRLVVALDKLAQVRRSADEWWKAYDVELGKRHVAEVKARAAESARKGWQSRATLAERERDAFRAGSRGWEKRRYETQAQLNQALAERDQALARAAEVTKTTDDALDTLTRELRKIRRERDEAVELLASYRDVIDDLRTETDQHAKVFDGLRRLATGVLEDDAEPNSDTGWSAQSARHTLARLILVELGDHDLTTDEEVPR